MITPYFNEDYRIDYKKLGFLIIDMLLVDSHCHLDRIPDYKLPDNLIPVTVGYSHSTNQKALQIGKKLKIPYVLGIAPQTAIKEDLSKLDEWIDFIKSNPPNAIGEVGLDYHWAKNEHDIEKEQIVFRRMLDLSQEMDLPLVIHARNAVHDVLDFLQLRNLKNPFMMHFFSGTLAEAKRAIDLGGLISITPLHSKGRRQVIKEIDLEHLLIETDAPYVVRKPEEVIKAAEYICEIKLKLDEVTKVTADNAIRFFKV
jgi:TatD DNase family protein